MNETGKIKIAITHDYLLEYGGAEMVLWEILKIFPQAELYSPIIRPTKKQRAFWLEVSKHKIHSSFLSSLPLPKLAFKFLLPLQIGFFKRLKFDDYDLVISSSAGFSKFLNLTEKTKHIAYIHTPPRFVWGYETSFFHKMPGVLRFILKPILNKWKRQDIEYAKKADLILTNSKNIQGKIRQAYKKDSTVIYPPADVANLLSSEPSGKEDFYLTIGRIYPYKRIDLIVEAFGKTKEKLIVIGDGPGRRRLERISRENISFRGFVDEDVKVELLQKAKGFVFAAEEDFGIVMVEALAAGTPVIAFAKGGAIEIVQEGKNGILFEEQTKESIIQGLKEFASKKFDSEFIKKSAWKFSSENFRKEMEKSVLRTVTS
ncbi:glycosyltransferase [Candidatus Dojkabacteria bacterium]|nr:glycosyltransferase [Candidatus Dojkabacteria bacterium]